MKTVKFLASSLVLSLLFVTPSMAASGPNKGGMKNAKPAPTQGVTKSREINRVHHTPKVHSASKYNMRAGGDLHLGASGLGFGFGGHFTMDVPVFEHGPGQSQVHGDLIFFPSGVASSSIFMLGAYGRYAFQVMPNLWVGPELGFGFLSVSGASVTVGATTYSGTGSSTAFLGLGGFAEGLFAPQWGWKGELRILANAGAAFLLSGGVNYYF